MGVNVKSFAPLLASLSGEKRASATCSFTSPLNVYVSENFVVSFHQWFRLIQLVEDSEAHGMALTEFVALKKMKSMKLGVAAHKLLTVPNAGGNSVLSEVLSYEMMERCFGAKLMKTEMEVEYFPEGGSITDYTCSVRGLSLAVSVTRAMKFCGVFTVEDAEILLMKKLRGVVQSSHNSLENWSKQILHVWCIDRQAAESMIRAYDFIPTEIKSNTLVLLTIAPNIPEIFMNPKKKTKV